MFFEIKINHLYFTDKKSQSTSLNLSSAISSYFLVLYANKHLVEFEFLDGPIYNRKNHISSCLTPKNMASIIALIIVAVYIISSIKTIYLSSTQKVKLVIWAIRFPTLAISSLWKVGSKQPFSIGWPDISSKYFANNLDT